MAFVPFRCMTCNRITQVDDAEGHCFCIYCGTRIDNCETPDALCTVTVECCRSSNFIGRHTFRFEVDGEEIGESVTGKTISFMLRKGTHQVQITIPRRKGEDSNTTVIEVTGDTRYRIEFGTFNLEPTLVIAKAGNEDQDSFF